MRKCFFSFHYKPDCQRASQVRSIGMIEGNRPAHDNDWESVTAGGELAIKRWINGQMEGRSCAVVLVGAGTANRKWINYEIVSAWNRKMGVVGIHIHGLKDLSGNISSKGQNPFDFVKLRQSGLRLSSIVKCYDPLGLSSKNKYAWISEYLSAAVEEAIGIRKQHK